MRFARVKTPHEPESTSVLVMKEGDTLQGEKRSTEWDGWLWCTNNSGISAWVPEAYLSELATSGLYHALREYSSFELSVSLGQRLKILHEEASWAWVQTSKGIEGWVPLENLEELPSDAESSERI